MIGIFVLAAVTIIIFALMFLHPTVGDERRVLRVRFVNIDKISVGTRVTFAGKPVGEVAAIHELKDAINERIPKDGLIYVYELILHVDSAVNVFNTDEISTRTSGLLGEKSVAIIPFPPKPGQVLRIVNDEILYAIEVGSVEDTLKEIKLIAGKMGHSLEAVDQIFAEIQEEQIVKNLSSTVQNFNALSARAVKSWDTVDQTLGDLSEASINLNTITTNVKKGEGTVGRLVMTDQLYLKLSSLLSKGEVVFNDINHYGLFYNLDKGWQRLRARRLNLLNRLSTPQEFRNFFNDEIDQINTSLARVSDIVEQTSSSPCACELFENFEFQKVYAELLRRVSDTEEALKMYNQQLVDIDVRKCELCN